MNELDLKLFEEAILIRQVETRLLELFSSGELNGTIHTCVGQEFSAIAFAGQLDSDDYVFSNHRCHGHYISFTGDYHGLIAELMGKKTGVCGGVGNSQHLCGDNFFSSGIQGILVPVAAGVALSNKIKKNGKIAVVYIGDGTLGEGILYETLNIISKWELPLLIVCENNYYAQSTPIEVNLAGDIQKRAEAFGIKTFSGDTWAKDELIAGAGASIDYVRKSGLPALHLVNTYRLNPHSKGDDHREPEEIAKYAKKDPINKFMKENGAEYEKLFESVSELIDKAITEIKATPEMGIDEYYDPPAMPREAQWTEIEKIEKRQVELINEFFDKQMSADSSVLFIGEDVLSPYGGAFKVSADLSEKHPEQVFSTPISESAIVGIANGLAISGFKPYVEIMFGDFMALAFNQLVNNSSKFFHMYNRKIKCPVVVRSPMGGKRGYGPTHSQTLDKFFVGMDNIKVVALCNLLDPREVYKAIDKEEHPVVVIENKLDFGARVGRKRIKGHTYYRSDADYPIVKITPESASPTATIVTYGGMVDSVVGAVDELFIEHEVIAEIIVLTEIHPIDFTEIIRSVEKTGKLYVAEEGSSFAGIGSEIIATVTERVERAITARRIAALPVPIPAVRALEEVVLPGSERIIATIGESLE